MKDIIIILSIVLLSSCTTQKRCLEKFPPQNNSTASYIETVKLDTLVQYVPGDTTFVQMPFDCPDQDTVIVDNAKQIIKYVVKDRIITIESICKEDSLNTIIANIRTELKESNNTVVEVPHVPRFWKIVGWLGIASIIIGGLYIAFKIRF